MDVSSIATTMMAMKSGQTRSSIGAAIIKMNANADASVVSLLQSQAGAGLGQKVDIRA